MCKLQDIPRNLHRHTLWIGPDRHRYMGRLRRREVWGGVEGVSMDWNIWKIWAPRGSIYP